MRFFETPIFTRVVMELLEDEDFTRCNYRDGRSFRKKCDLYP